MSNPITVYFAIVGDDGLENVRTAKLPAVPRIGETVELVGLEFGGDNSWEVEGGRFEGTSTFRIRDVVWENPTEEGEYSITCVIDEHEPQTPKLFCACTNEEIAKHGVENEQVMRGRVVSTCQSCGRELHRKKQVPT